MECNDWQTEITALANGEPTLIDAHRVREHVAGCPRCQRHRVALITDPRPIDPGPVAQAPQLAETVVRTARKLDRGAVSPILRVALALTATALLVLHAPTLVLGGAGHDTAEHAARHAAACPVAFAIALVAVALRPAKARGLLPVTAALAAALFITGAVDISRGMTPILAEADHLPEIIGALLVWLTAHHLSHPHHRAPARTATHLRIARS